MVQFLKLLIQILKVLKIKSKIKIYMLFVKPLLHSKHNILQTPS